MGTYVHVRVNILDPFFKSIDATDLLTLSSSELSYGKASAQFDPAYLKNIEINTSQTATRYGDLEVVKKLITKGLDVNQADFNGKTALHYAEMFKQPDIIKLLKKQTAGL